MIPSRPACSLVRDERAFWAAAQLAHLLAGRWLAPPVAGTLPAGVSVDSRTLAKGELFVALKGERFDGRDFLPEAIAKGAWACVVDDEATARAAGGPALLVENTRAALVALAQAWRAGPVAAAKLVAVTGSNGKTTTCRLLGAALERAGAVVASPRSFNNDVGAPLALLRATPLSRFVVSEIGSSAPGEVARLARVAQPDIACVLCAELAHTQGLGDRAGVIREKASLAAALRPEGLAIAPADDAALLAAVQSQAPSDARVISVGEAKRADVRIVHAAHEQQQLDDGSRALGVSFRLADSGAFFVPALGLHNARNAAIAVVVGRELGVRDSDLAQGLASAEPAPMRLALVSVAGVTILNDAYNANPASTVAALRTFREVCATADRRIVALGDLLELGACEAEGLDAVAREIARADAPPIDALHALGPIACRVAAIVQQARSGAGMRIESHGALADDPSLAKRIASELRAGDAVLLKGSRGARLEAVEDAIRARVRDHDLDQAQPADIPCSTS